MINRRIFVKNSLSTGLFSLSGIAGLSFLELQNSTCKACAFHPLVGKRFTAVHGEHEFKLLLTDVKESDLGDGPIPFGVRTDPFSCLWKIEGDEIEEGMVVMDHPQLGKIEVHLFSKWKENGGRIYETIWG